MAAFAQARSMFERAWPARLRQRATGCSPSVAWAFSIPLTFACFRRRLNQAAKIASELDHLDQLGAAFDGILVRKYLTCT